MGPFNWELPRVSRGYRIALVVMLLWTSVAIAAPSGAQSPTFVTTPGAQTIAEDANSGDLSVVLADPDMENLVLTATSGNTTLIPNANLVVTPVTGGPGTYSRTIRVTPAANRNTVRDNSNQPVLITLQVTDTSGNSTSNSFNVTVTEVNDVPVANADALSAIDEDSGPRAIDTATLMANDNAGPLEGGYQTFSVTSASSGIGGTVSLVGSTITFTPTANYFGPASFDYTITDNGISGGGSDARSATGTVTFTINPVNDAPVAVDDAFNVDEDNTLTASCAGTCVLSNDTDVEANTLTASLVAGTTHGALTLNTDGSFSYVPEADYHGSDSFTYRANDGSADSNIATVTITVAAIDDLPVANDDGPVSTIEDVPASDIGVQANDAWGNNPSLGDGPLTITLLNGGASANGGSATIDDAGTPGVVTDDRIDFVPAANYYGSDTVSYRLCDSDGDCDDADVSFTITAVNDEPSFDALAHQTINEDAGAQTVTGLLQNASAGPANESAQTLSLAVSNDNAALFAAQPAIDLGTGTLTYTGAANAFGTATVTVTLSDDGGTSNGGDDSFTRTFDITIDSINDAPVANADNYSTNEDTTLTVAAPGLLDNDSDVDGDTLSAVLVSGPTHGALILSPNGGFSYTPSADYHGADSFTYKANDGTADSATVTVSLTIDPVNDAPVALADSYSTDEDTTLTVPADGVLGNDADVDGDSITAIQVAGPAHGSLSLAADGGFTYQPDANYHGDDSFTYKANDGTADSDTVTVSLTVNSINDAPTASDDSYGVIEDDTLTISANGVLGNDADIDADALTAVLVDDVAHGTLSLNANGGFTYTPAANFNGSDSFTYRASDGGAQSNLATVTITVTAVNDAPSFDALADQSVAEDSGAQTVPSFLTNASTGPADESGQTLSLNVSNDNNALFAVSPAISLGSGTLTYTPAANAFGTATVTVTLSDDGGTANGGDDATTRTFQLQITAVNDAPVATDDSYSTDEDTALHIAAPGVLGNDSDIDMDSLHTVLIADVAHGTLSLNPDGGFDYTPAANYHGGDSFTYQAHDGTTNSNTVTVTLTVNSINDVPAADDDSYSTDEDTALHIAAPGVLGNDSDADLDALQAILVGNVAHGSLTLNADGGFDYTPAADYHGADSFTYKANDGTADSSTATVTITVNPINDAPTATGDSYSTDEDTTLTVTAPGVLDNDGDVDADTLSAVLDADVSHGTLSLAANGGFTYTPASNYTGADSFTYHVSDGQATSATVTVNLTVQAVDDPPVANDDSYSTNEDTALDDGSVLGNDTDVEMAALTATVVSAPQHGTLTLQANGNFHYEPAANFHGSDSFTYTANDGNSDSNIATVTITVAAVNDAPVANADSYTVNEDVAFDATAGNGVLANDTDVDQDTLNAVLVAAPAHGTLTLQADGSFHFVPSANYHGADSFTYRANDGALDSNIATVTLDIVSVNDAPVASDDTYATDEDTTLNVLVANSVLNNDTDTENDALTAILVAGPAHGTLTLNANGSFDYTPNAQYFGSDSFTYRANDGQDDSNIATVSIAIASVNDAPTANNDDYSGLEDGTITATLATGVLANDSDVENDSLTAALVDAPTHGNVSLAADGSFTYTPDANYNGADSFTYRANDGDADSNLATVSLTITAVNDEPSFDALADQTVAEDAGAQTVAGFLANASAGPANESAQTLSVSSSTDNDALFASVPAIDVQTGTLTYAAAANTHGQATVTVTLHDDGGTADGGDDSFTRTFTITVQAVNDPPVAQDDSHIVLEDQTLTVNAPGVLDNDTDVDADPLTAQLVAGATHGSLSLNADGSFSYTPNANFNGSDSFTYRADDGDAQSATATVTIAVTAVNDAPSFDSLADQTVAEDAGAQSVAGFLANASAGPADEAGQTLSLQVSNDNAALFSVAPAINLGTGQLTYTSAQDANGVAHVTVTLGDSGGTANGGVDSFTRAFTITVTAVNDPPRFVTVPDDIAAVLEDSTTGPLQVELDDVEGDTVTLLRASGNQALFPNANVALAGSGYHRTLTFTTAVDQNSAIVDPDFTEITLTAVDSAGGTAQATLRIGQVTPVDDAPRFTIAAPAVTSDEDAGPRTVSGFASGASVGAATASDELGTQTLQSYEVTQTGGTLAFTSAPQINVANGALSYETAANANGTAMFQAVLIDSGSGTAPNVNRSAPRSFSITVANVNDAPVAQADAYTTDEDVALTIPASGVLGNDTDVDGDTLTAVVGAQPAHGTLALNANGGFVYTPAADYNGADSFTYQASDGAAQSSAVTVSLTINAVNDAPTTTVDSYSVAEDGDLTIAAPGVLGNDSDVEGSSLSAIQVSGPTHGTLSLASDGGFHYTPAANYHGADAFAYRASDGTAQSVLTTVSLDVTSVNDAPTANAQNLSTAEDTALAITLTATDADGDTLSYTVQGAPTHGTLSGSGANLTYTPAANYFGADSFTFVANDGTVDSAAATITLDVTAVNDAPSAVADSYSTNEDQALTIAAPGVLGNDTDVENNALTATLVAGPSHGTLSFNADGGFVYTPASNYQGADSFTYKANDGAVDSTTVTVSLAVTAINDTPVAQAQSLTTPEDTALAITLTATDADGDTLSYTVQGAPTHGTLSGSGANLTYTPAANYFGADSFTFVANDGTVDSATATITLDVTAVNDAPSAVDDSYSTNEDQALTIAAPGVLGNDTDVENNALTATLVAGPSHGTLSFNADGGFVYTPASNYQGADSFTYRANDGSANSAPATVSLSIGATNDPPVAQTQSLTTLEDTALSITLTATDADGDTLTYAVQDAPTHGSLSGTGATLSYTPNADYNGADSFTFVANDGTVNSAPATISLTVLAVNDRPSFTAASTQSWPAGSSGARSTSNWAQQIVFGPADEAGQAISAYVVLPVSDPTGVLSSPVTVSNDGTLSYVLSGASGVASVDVYLRDNGGTANGGIDLSQPLRLVIAAGLQTDLAVTITDGQTSTDEGQLLTYTIVASNKGASTATNARVTDPLPADLSNAHWTCAGIGGGTCPASGTGDIDAQVTLPAGASVTFTLIATVTNAFDDQITNTAFIAPPPTMVDNNGANNQASDIDEVWMFRNDFD